MLTKRKTAKVNGETYDVIVKSGRIINIVGVYEGGSLFRNRSNRLARSWSVRRDIDTMTEDTIVEAVETYERKKAKQDEFEQKVKHAIGHSTEQAQKPSVRQAYQMMGDEESATFALELLRLVKEE